MIHLAYLAKILDGNGLYGSLIHAAIALFFGGSALCIFFFLWKNGRLDMNEEPAHHMLKDDTEINCLNNNKEN